MTRFTQDIINDLPFVESGINEICLNGDCLSDICILVITNDPVPLESRAVKKVHIKSSVSHFTH